MNNLSSNNINNIKPKPARCHECQKKVGLIEYKCKCGMLFCISHLQAEKHKCIYDYKTEGMNKIKREIDVGILKDKIIRI